MLAPFRGRKDDLTRKEYHWNFVQSSTRMCVEIEFGMLKGRWRILLKKVDVHLKNVPELVSTCLVLHNICIVFRDSFWKTEWMQEATDEVYNNVSTIRQVGTSTQERLVVVNHVLQSLASIDDNYRDPGIHEARMCKTISNCNYRYRRANRSRALCKKECNRKESLDGQGQGMYCRNFSIT